MPQTNIILKNKNKARRLTLSDIKIHYKITVLKQCAVCARIDKYTNRTKEKVQNPT